MFNSITGEISGMDGNTVFITTSGIEWALRLSARSIGKLPEKGSRIRLYVHLHHREDNMTLYGFLHPEERSLFLDLCKVSGIGPKQAVKILSAAEYGDLLRSLDDGDADILSGLPGVGAKTAQKMILALRGKLTMVKDPVSSKYGDIARSLVEMGFERKRAEEAVAKAVREKDYSNKDKETAEKQIFKNAIIYLSRE